MINNIDKIEKTDDLSKWRVKINNVFSMIKNIFPSAPKNKKTMLVSDGENISWMDIPENKTDVEPKAKDLKVSGILSTEHIVVGNIANFKENIEVDKSVIASSLLLQNNAIIRFANAYYSTNIRPTKNGLKIDEITVNKSNLSLEKIYFKHCHIETTDTSLIFSGKNENVPLSVNFDKNIVYCSNGIISPKFYFNKNTAITATEYTGNANSATRLKNKVKIYGNAFDGSSNLSGVISDCIGIKFSVEHSYIEFPTKSGLSLKLEEKDGVLTYNGEFNPQKLFVNSEHYAEYYPSLIKLEKGDVISFDFNSDKETYVKVNKTDGHPLGVVTDDYAMIIGKKTENLYPVCNKGRVHAKVIGKVERGDNLCISLYDGILRKLQPKENLTDTWAIALESSDKEDVKLIKIHII